MAGATVHLKGIGVSPGVVVGRVAKLSPPPVVPAGLSASSDPDADIQRTRDALDRVRAELGERSAHAASVAVDVLSAQAAMAADPVLAANIFGKIRDGKAAPEAVKDALAAFGEQLLSIGGYLAERAADLEDIGNRVISVLLGLPMPGLPIRDEPFVLLAQDLAPADTATLDAANVLAIVTEHGGPTSHTAIIAKSLGIPAVVACRGAFAIEDGTRMLVDGMTGAVVTEPSEAEVSERVGRVAKRRAAVTEYAGPGRLSDGSRVQLLVNVGTSSDIERAGQADCEGVGLFRTEFLFLDRPSAPSVEEQRMTYRQLFETFSGRKVVVRTLDAGADKPLAFVRMADEPNPALGIRGFRTARFYPELLDDQLRAISRAAMGSGADVWVMAPMVATPAEAAEFAKRAHELGLPLAGAMVEVPAAALRAEHLLSAADFLSIGTNDLSQYTYAMDRETGALPELLDPWQPGLLELVRLTAQAGQRAGKPVGVCGEAASFPQLAVVFAGLGVTSLSMAPVSLAEVRAELSLYTAAQCAKAAEVALAERDGESAREAVGAYLDSVLQA
ncbi:MAG: phosphoenolpyruvate--protein phosphotransferase [Actinomycetota bacterium]|nr:phosphoenolpyruvate--protein phosphotransferase [Actinomycetota bacterium]